MGNSSYISPYIEYDEKSDQVCLLNVDREFFTFKYVPSNAVNKNAGGKPATLISIEANPNPFHAAAVLTVRGSGKRNKALCIYNLQGKLIRDFSHALRGCPPVVTVHWNATNLPPGVYVAKLMADEKSYTKKITLLK